jgi:Transposase DDE domain
LGEGLFHVWPVTRSVTSLLTSDVSGVPLRLRRNTVLRFIRRIATWGTTETRSPGRKPSGRACDLLEAEQIPARPITWSHALFIDPGAASAYSLTSMCSRSWADPCLGKSPSTGEQPQPVPRGRIPAGLTPKQLMSRKLRTKKGKAAHARRKAIVEPVFGQINVAQGGHQLRLRGQVKPTRVDVPPGLPRLPQTRRLRMDNHPAGNHLTARETPLRLSQS